MREGDDLSEKTKKILVALISPAVAAIIFAVNVFLVTPIRANADKVSSLETRVTIMETDDKNDKEDHKKLYELVQKVYDYLLKEKK